MTWLTKVLEATNVVTVNVIDAIASTSGTKPARILVARDGNINPITVNYTASGSAIPGIDYVALSGSVTLPLGVDSALIEIIPFPGTLLSSLQMVNVTLTPSPAYTIGAPSTAVVIITEEPLQLDEPKGTIVISRTNGTISTFRQASDSDAARGAALWAAWQTFKEGESMTIGPGRYFIQHELAGFSNQTIRGAGMDVTTIALDDLNGMSWAGTLPPMFLAGTLRVRRQRFHLGITSKVMG